MGAKKSRFSSSTSTVRGVEDSDDSDSESAPLPLLRRQWKLKESRVGPRPLQRRTMWSPAVAADPAGLILGEPLFNVADLYDLHEEIGIGSWGTVWRCTDKVTGEEFACYSVRKNVASAATIRREVLVRQLLSGLPGVVKFERAYEDADHVHMVTELCPGRELVNEIEEDGRFTEEKAAAVFRELIAVVHRCHMMGVVLKDLNRRNVMLVIRNDGGFHVKVRDFGSAVFFQEGDAFMGPKETPGHHAPEILREMLCENAADVWGAGFFLYQKLSGRRPTAPVDTAISEPWPSVSDHAKNLVSRMLVFAGSQRIPTSEILEHPWVKLEGETVQVPAVFKFLIRFRKIREMSKIKRIALSKIAENLTDDELKRYKMALHQALHDGDPGMEFDDFMGKLSVLDSNLSDAEVLRLINPNHSGRNGRLEFLEFIAALVPTHDRESYRNLLSAFRYFDVDGDGFITAEDLEVALQPYRFKRIGKCIRMFMAEADKNQDKKIIYEEFVDVMKDQSRYLPFLEEERTIEVVQEALHQPSSSQRVKEE